MIIEIPYTSKKDGALKLVKRVSTTGFKIRKVGTDEIYDEAIDVADASFVYEETNEKIDEE